MEKESNSEISSYVSVGFGLFDKLKMSEQDAKQVFRAFADFRAKSQPGQEVKRKVSHKSLLGGIIQDEELRDTVKSIKHLSDLSKPRSFEKCFKEITNGDSQLTMSNLTNYLESKNEDKSSDVEPEMTSAGGIFYSKFSTPICIDKGDEKASSPKHKSAFGHLKPRKKVVERNVEFVDPPTLKQDKNTDSDISSGLFFGAGQTSPQAAPTDFTQEIFNKEEREYLDALQEKMSPKRHVSKPRKTTYSLEQQGIHYVEPLKYTSNSLQRENIKYKPKTCQVEKQRALPTAMKAAMAQAEMSRYWLCNRHAQSQQSAPSHVAKLLRCIDDLVVELERTRNNGFQARSKLQHTQQKLKAQETQTRLEREGERTKLQQSSSEVLKLLRSVKDLMK